MDGIGGPEPFLVLSLRALGRELLLLGAIEVVEGPRHQIARPELLRCAERLEQPPAHDLKALLSSSGPPGGLDAPHDVAQPLQGSAAPLATHLHVVRPGVGRAGGVRGGQADHQQALLGHSGRLGERLGEGEVGLKATAGQVTGIVELAGIGHPLVDQDQAGAVLVHQLAQHVARAGGPLVVGAHPLIGSAAPQLPGQLAPQGAHQRTVGLTDRVAGRQLEPDQDDSAHGRQRCIAARLLEHALDAGQVGGRDAGEEVIERQHGVGLAAAKVGLELHHRVAALSAEPAHPVHQHLLEALGQVGALEESHRVAVLVRALALVHLPQVGGELGLLKAPAGHVGMGGDDLAPGLESAVDLALDGRARATPPFAARLLLIHQPPQLLLHPPHLVGLGGRDGGQEALGRVQGAVGVVAGKGLLVRPAVAHLAQLAHQAALGVAQRQPKDLVPLIPHETQDERRVQMGQLGVLWPLQVVGPTGGSVGNPVGAVLGAHLALDKGQQPLAEQVQRLADAFVVGDGHTSLLA